MNATRVLKRLWNAQWGPYFCIATRRREVWHDYFFTRDQFDDEWLDERSDRDLYWCCHGLTRPVRRAQYAARSHLLWADLDQVNPFKLEVEPTVAWRTSRGRYAAIWRCDGEPSRGLRRGFNNAIGADAGWHLCKVLRIPCTLNHKYDPPQLGKLLWDDGPVHRLRDLQRYAVNDDGGGDVGDVAVKLLDVDTVRAKYRGKFDNDLRFVAVDGRDGTVAGGGRYRIIWKLGQQLKAAGANADEVATLIYGSRAWRSKHGPYSHDRLSREVSRIMTKGGGPR